MTEIDRKQLRGLCEDAADSDCKLIIARAVAVISLLDAAEAKDARITTLERQLAEAREALKPFSFPAYPDLFRSTDGGCTEALVCDADVQRARAILAAEAQGKEGE